MFYSRIFGVIAFLLMVPASLQAACDAAPYSLPNQQWRQISLPCALADENTVAAVFGDDIPGVLGSDWALYRYDGDRYVPLDKTTDKLSQGVGYWIIQINNAGETRQLDLPETSSPTPAGRFDIRLKTRDSAVRWNMIGYPFKAASSLNNTRVVTASGRCMSGCSFNAAEAAKIVHNKLWSFNGVNYIEVGADDKFTPWKSYWLATMDNAHAAGSVSLSIAPNNERPKITQFVTAQSTSTPMLEVSIEGSDDQGITGWLISETPSTPALDDKNWQREPPSHYSIFSPGNVTLYAWAKDASGNISTAATQHVNYILPTQYSDYSPGEFLQTPQNAIEFVKVSADFWEASKDTLNGGFFTHVDQRGNVLSNRDKSFLTQSRHAYGFARAFMLTGNESYLDDARYALQFMYEHGWDNTYDGWYFMANEYGDIHAGSGWEWDYNTKTKWSFQQHYALLGIGALYEASRKDTDYNWLIRGYNSNELHLWDNNPAQYGYYDLANRDWSAPRGKGFTPTVDAVTTNVLSLYLLTHEEKYLKRLKQLGNNMIDHLAASMSDPSVKMGMVEKYNRDWSYKQSGWGWDTGDTGHVLKAAWSLGRIFLITGEEKYRTYARKFIQRTWTDGSYDHTYGGPYSEFKWNLGTLTDTDKNFWRLEQGYTGGVIGWYIEDNEARKNDALNIAQGSLDFFMTHLPDKHNGEIYARASADGSTITHPSKSGLFKAGYHGIELGYYAYLYGSLFYANQPVSLYYKIEKKSVERSIKLSPVAIEDKRLVISSIKLDGQLYSDYQAATRVLKIPAGVGGKFQVTFQRTE